MEEILATLTGFLVPAFVIGFSLTFAFKIQKKIYKDLFEKFESEEKIPAEAIKLTQFKYGKGKKANNTVKAAERQDALFLKFPLQKALKISFDHIASVKVKKGFFKSKVIQVHLKDQDLKTLYLTLAGAHLPKFPYLLKKETSDNTQPQFPKAAEISLKSAISQTDPELLSNAGNAIRTGLLIFAIIGIVVFFITYYA